MTKNFVCLLGLAIWLFASGPAMAAFGLSTAADSYTVDTGANLVFKVRRTDNGSSTQSAGDLMSLVYNGVEYQNQSKGSHLNSGFDFLYNGVSAVSVNAAVVNTDFIKITVTAGNLTHYYMARSGYPHIYMATYFTSEPDTLGLCRYIVRIPQAKLPNGPVPSDIRNNTGAIESADIFGMADGSTRSKHYSNMRLKDWSHIGATGSGLGVWMLRSNHEGDSGGPFYRSLLNQCGDDQEITYIINYGEAQTEAFRTSILNGPYVLAFTNGSAPTAPDTSWVADMGLTGFVGPAGRGAVSATGITGRDTAYNFTVGFANATAQYWADASQVSGAFTCSGMLPGTYTMKVYKNELAVHSAQVTVVAGVTTALGSVDISGDPSAALHLWRIGNWDGSPGEFLNGDKVTTMHPSDVRMASWTPGPYVIGSSVPATGMPCYQWKEVNGSQVIQFQLSASELVASTIRVGLTCAYEGARPKISLNSWTYPTNPAASTQPETRTLTVGTYRGNNTTYSFAVPASALVAGTNTLTIFPISGSGATGFLSAGYSLDCIEMYQGSLSTEPLPAAPTGLAATGNLSQVNLSWTQAFAGSTYRILRAPASGGPYVTIASGVSGTSYTDSTVTNGVTYYYVVSRMNGSGSGPFSAEASATAGGLVAWYAFEGNAQDGSGQANHGTASNVSYPVDGSGAQTGLFNGTTSHVVIPRSVQDDFTVALWIKTTGTGGAGTQWWSGDGLVDGEVTGTAADWGLSLLNSKIAFGIGGPDTTLASTSTVNDGQWHHVAATRKSSSGATQIYIDGVLQVSGSGPTGGRSAPPSLRIGSMQTGNAGGFFNGGIDGVRLYNKVLTGPEVTAITSAGLQVPPAPAGLAATSTQPDRVQLTWNASATATSYTVKRGAVNGGPYSVVASGITTLNFTDTGRTPGTTYYYVLSASNVNGEGPNSAQASATTTIPAPLVHLRFDETSGTTAADSSGNGWHGTLVNGPAWQSGANGKINNALGFDGSNDHVTLPIGLSAGITAGLNDFTIATWVKWNGGGDWQRVVDIGTGSDNYLFFTPRTGNVSRFAIRNWSGPEQVLDGPPLAPGVWTHVAITLSGNTATLFLNGAGVGTNPMMTLRPSSLGNTTQNYLGKSQFAADPYFNGTLDEFQIHNRALSSAEINALYSPPLAPGGLAATAGDGQVSLTWNAVGNATGYHLKRATVSGGPFTTIASNLTLLNYADTTVSNGTTYYYAVTAIAGVAESPRSAEKTATPLSPVQAWRLANFGSTANSGDAADSADPDHDGTANEIEFRLGLDPRDGSSSFTASVARTGAGFVLTWPAAPGLNFEIHRSSTPAEVGGVIASVTGVGTYTDTSPPVEAAFYRVVLLP